MEIYKDLSNPASKEFEQLLNSQFTKTENLEEGKIITGVVNKVTDNFVFLEVPGLKSEPILDINELKSMGMLDKAKVGEKISVLLERLEDKKGEVLVSASKAQKIQGWDKLVEAYEKNEPIMGKITGRVKGGCIVEHIDTGSLMFLPGSQISDKPLKDISHLMNEPQKFALIKLDKVRGNACVSRREIISSFKKEDKIKIVEKFKVGDLIKGAEVKGYSSFGCFFSVNGELDVLVHLQEISYSRVNHPDEVFTIGEKHDLKVISVDLEKLQVGCSVKQLTPDPFENISNYELNKKWSLSANFLFQTGQPITYPNAQYKFSGFSIPNFEARNSSRLPAYHRLDFSAVYSPKNKLGQWVFGVYNIYNRKNAASIRFQENLESGNNEALRLTIFGIIPSVTYNFKF
mgnify:CR=1 FL=1